MSVCGITEWLLIYKKQHKADVVTTTKIIITTVSVPSDKNIVAHDYIWYHLTISSSDKHGFRNPK